MQMDDFAADVASDVSDSSKPQFGVILLMVIGSVISVIIQWFFTKYVVKEEAAKEFLDYYNNMGPIRRMTLAWKVSSEMKKHPDTGVSSDKLAVAMTNKFKKLTIDDVIALAEKKE
jgi:hypothetical protein